MKKSTLRTVEFHRVYDLNERDLIKAIMFKRRAGIFLKRGFITLIIAIILILMQYIARYTIPNIFSAKDTIQKEASRIIGVWGVINMLSYLQLWMRDTIIFEMERTEVAVVRIVEKLESNRMGLLPFDKGRAISCITAPEIGIDESGFYMKDGKFTDLDKIFLEDVVIIDGSFRFSVLRKGEYVFIKRELGFETGAYKYKFIA